MQKLAEELKIWIPTSFFEADGPHHYNSLAMIDPDGKIAGVYRKSHIPDGPGYEEKFYFRPGNTGFKVWHGPQQSTLGVGVCWDQWYPETARAMMLMGAEILFYPTAIGTEPHDPDLDTSRLWRRAMIGHAVSNVVPVVAANRIGTEGGQRFYGHSFICDERGDILAEFGAEETGVLVATLDLAAGQEAPRRLRLLPGPQAGAIRAIGGGHLRCVGISCCCLSCWPSRPVPRSSRTVPLLSPMSKRRSRRSSTSSPAWRRRGIAAIFAATWTASPIPTWCSSRAAVSSRDGRVRLTIMSAIMADRRNAAGQLHFFDIKIEMLAPDAAQLISRYKLDRPENPQDGINTRLMRKRDGKWVIALNHVSSVEAGALIRRLSSASSKSTSSFFQNFAHVWVAMAARLIGRLDEDVARVGQPGRGFLGNSIIALVDEIVAGIDPGHGHRDPLQRSATDRNCWMRLAGKSGRWRRGSGYPWQFAQRYRHRPPRASG